MPGIVTLRRMEFETYTIALLVTNPDAPELDDEEAARLQDAHMSHLADLHGAGHLLAAGPLSDEQPLDRGLAILSVGPEQERPLEEPDQGVRAWIVTREGISQRV